MHSRTRFAVELFHEGYNCAQSVFAAYADIYGIDFELALRLSASFGAGMGRMREVCGAVSGMFMVAGLETAAVQGKDIEKKKRNYELVQQLAAKFKEKYPSIICKELLGLDQKGINSGMMAPSPEARTAEYYKKRPCAEQIAYAAKLIETYILPLSPKEEMNQLVFHPVITNEQIVLLASMADEIWHQHYQIILNKDQIDYMVEKFQSFSSITNQMQTEGYEYYFIQVNHRTVGYVGIKNDQDKLFLSKFYLYQHERKKGYAGETFQWLISLAQQRNQKAIWLTVNRYNSDSIAVYEKIGFQKLRMQVSPIGNGYVMDDYVMELPISLPK